MAHIEDRWHASRDGVKARSGRYGTGLRWKVRYEAGGAARSKSFARRADAERFKTTVEAEALRGEYVDRSDRTTVAAYARRYAASRPHGPRTARRVASFITNDIEGTPLGSRALADVRPSEVQSWVTGRAAVLAPSTLRNLVSLLRSVFASAVLDRLIGSSPCVRLSLPPARRERIVPLTVPQVRALAAAMPARNRAMVITQAGLGLRIGELLGLRAADVSFLGRTVRVHCQIAPGTRTRTDVKTPTSRRTVPLPQVVADALAAHIAAFPPAADGTLFTTRFGLLYSHAYYGTVIFKAALEKAGLPVTISTHDLRHHYASVLLHAGESVVAVAERLGHENAALVLSTYGHLMPGSEDATRQAVDAAWADLPATSRTRPVPQR